jgi:hypothetical protein
LRFAASGRAIIVALGVLLVAGLPVLTALSAGDAQSGEAADDSATDGPSLLAPLDRLFGRTDTAETGGPADRSPRQRLRTLTTAPQRPRLAGPGPTRTSLERRNPRLRIDIPAPGARAAAAATPGVRWAAEYRLAELPVAGAVAADGLRVAFVDPAGFRVFTPHVTAQSDALWQGVAAGSAVLSFEAAHRLGVAPGDAIRIGETDRRYAVAGVASLAPADVADVLLPRPAAHELAADVTAGILVGLDRLRDLDDVRARLLDANLGDVNVVDPEAPYHAELVGPGDVAAAFEPFTFRHRGGGLLDIDPDWVDRHIVKASVPVLGEVTCHRLIVPQLRAALEEIVARELDDLLDADDYGGCWVPRYIGFQETRPLSMHAWGIAFDVNVHTNLYGDPPQLDERIVEVFDRHGFRWGGDWRTPDGMHFELRELTSTPG